MNKFTKILLLPFALSLIAFHFCKAQTNLVPNWSFEDTLTCPTNFNQISDASGWSMPTTGTSDYYNSCSHTYNGIVGVPQNLLGWENAKSGVAYAGICTTSDLKHSPPSTFCPECNNYREYIQTRLTDTLIAGKKYQVSFYVSLADSFLYACNNIGAYFSSIPVSAPNFWLLPYTPQIANDTLFNTLTNKNGWTLVSGTFIAAGGEKYITLGNFNDSVHSDTTFVGGGGHSIDDSTSYYYIDDVKVLWFDSIKTGINENENNVFKLYPNPSNGVFEITNNKFKIESTEIYNVYGIKVYSSSQQQLQINLSDQPSGVYFLRLKTSEGIIERKIIIKK